MKRILVAQNVARARNGGMSRIMGLIHDQFIRAGHVVDYYCAEDVPAGLNGRLALFTFPILVRRHAVAAARSGNPYDLINVHEPSSAAISTWKKAAGSPAVVVTSHGVEQRGWNLALEEMRLGREGPTFKTRVIYPLTSLWQSAIGLRKADHIFCLNGEDRNYLMQCLHLSENKITRIFPGADRIYATVSKARDYGRTSRLLFAGTWRKNKGIEDLAPAFVTLAMRWPHLTLIVLGAGVSQAAVHNCFPEEIRPRIECIQTVDEAENAAIYASTDIYILPSLFEGTPLTLIEAMMSGMPIVTTDTCGMKDVIQDGRNGLLIPIRSPEAIVAAVERLIGDPAQRAQLGRAAQSEALEKYTWEHVAGSVREVYEYLWSAKG